MGEPAQFATPPHWLHSFGIPVCGNAAIGLLPEKKNSGKTFTNSFESKRQTCFRFAFFVCEIGLCENNVNSKITQYNNVICEISGLSV